MQHEVRGGGSESKKILVIYQEQKQFINCYTFFYTIENQSSFLWHSSCPVLVKHIVPVILFISRATTSQIWLFCLCAVPWRTLPLTSGIELMAWEKLMVSSWIGLDWICLTTTHVLQDILAVLHKWMSQNCFYYINNYSSPIILSILGASWS